MRINIIKSLSLLLVMCGLVAPVDWGHAVRSRVAPENLDLGSSTTTEPILKFVVSISIDGVPKKLELDLFINPDIQVNEGISAEEFSAIHGSRLASQIFCNRISDDSKQLSEKPFPPSIITMFDPKFNQVYPLISLNHNSQTLVGDILNPDLIDLIQNTMQKAMQLPCMQILPTETKMDIEPGIIRYFQDHEKDIDNPKKSPHYLFACSGLHKIMGQNKNKNFFEHLQKNILTTVDEQTKSSLLNKLMILASVEEYKRHPQAMYSWISRHLEPAIAGQSLCLTPGLCMRSETVSPLVYIYLHSQAPDRINEHLDKIQKNCMESLQSQVIEIQSQSS